MVNHHALTTSPYLMSPEAEPNAGNDVMLLYAKSSLPASVSAPLPLAPTPAVAASFSGRGVTRFGDGKTSPSGSTTFTPQKTPNGALGVRDLSLPVPGHLLPGCPGTGASAV